jgi:hypothetical protein
MPRRRFPPPWTVDETDACFIVRDHNGQALAGVDLDPDLNKYDLEHACTDHPRMSRQKWTEVYKDAFARY